MPSFARPTILALTALLLCALCALAEVNQAEQLLRRGRYDQALQVLLPLAREGDAEAQYYLGEMYGRGLGVARDLQQSVQWLRFAAGSEPRARYRLAEYLMKGMGGLPREPREAAVLLHQATGAGVPGAWYLLGVLYRDHNFVLDLTDDGPVILPDLHKAIDYFYTGAKAGSPRAQYALAEIFQQGNGLPRNPAQARKYYAMAAEQDYPPAQAALGAMLARGKGVARDLVEAYKWLTLAAEAGNPEAVAEKRRVYELMTVPQIDNARELVRIWKQQKAMRDEQTTGPIFP